MASADDIRSTRSSFAARWNPINGATGYRLEVSNSSSFNDHVAGYQGVDVGTATSWMVTGLKPGTTYYYRVSSASDVTGPVAQSEVMSATTVAGTGLIINPTFDSSITSDPNATAIEATITHAIAVYESLFSDPITVEIRFRYSTTRPNGTAIPSNFVAVSNYVVYSPLWSNYINSLQADAKTSVDTTANASLPSSPLSANVVVSSANGRAIGRNNPPAMFEDGSVAVGGPYDGIVTLNASAPYSFVRPENSGSFDAQRGLEHEMDEVLGLGSYLDSTGSNLRPQDLFSWSGGGVRNTSTSGNRYFSIDEGSTVIVFFNQLAGYDHGDWRSASCPQAFPYVQNALGCPGQAADVSQTSPEGINLDAIGYDAIFPKGQLLNIATRMEVLGNDKVLIAGFIVSGTGTKKIIIRGIGPSLQLSGPLADPTLELHQGNTLLKTNDNWKIDDQTGQSQEAEVAATNAQPGNELEPAIVATLSPGTYSAIMAGKNGGTGIGVVELYDLDQNANARLANISSRGFVDTNDNVMIGGFIIGGPTGEDGRVLIRALGPSLTSLGVAGALSDPTLELHDGNGATIASNDNWKVRSDGSSQEAEIESTATEPTNDFESALVRILTPGNYTAVVRGNNNATGVGLVEIYNLQ
ncbi:MAG TPA: NF038122 family metalloprotease [Chthoniobacterales bacterium]|nr:NF038122 family metalloprotease [Chthoniobacterales bacterium]